MANPSKGGPQMSGTGPVVIGPLQRSSSTADIVTTSASVVDSFRPKDRQTNLEDAVYAHIHAVRSLGRTQINTAEIAAALGINVGRVSEVLSRLRAKGVRTL